MVLTSNIPTATPTSDDAVIGVDDLAGTPITKKFLLSAIKTLFASISETLTNKTINTANNTITVEAADVSDFDTEVSNNSSVSANTSKVSNATHTGDVSGSTTLTIGSNKVTSSMLQSDIALSKLQLKKEVIMLALTAPDTDIEVANDLVSFRMPFKFYLTEVIVSAHQHSSSSTMTIDVNDDGSTLIGGGLSLTTTDKVNQSTQTDTIADDSIITVDCTAAGTTVAGVVVYLVGYQIV